MLNGFEHGLQIFARALGTARQIDDQAAANARLPRAMPDTPSA